MVQVQHVYNCLCLQVLCYNQTNRTAAVTHEMQATESSTVEANQILWHGANSIISVVDPSL